MGSEHRVATLETQNTLLRPFKVDDAPALYEITRRTDVMRFVAHPHQNIQETENSIIKGFFPHYEKHHYGRLAVIDKTTNQLIGFSGLKCLEEIKEVDLAYTLHPDFWGRGLATEVAIACLVYASNELQLKRVIGLSTPNNTSSIRVLNKIGMRYEKNILFWGEEYQQHAWSSDG